MKTIQEALSAMMPAFVPVGSERVPLAEAAGRFVAEDVIARQDLPPFDNSAMDGYAVRAEDLASGSASLPVVAESRAGGEAPAPLTSGQAVRIFTGAVVPEGADAIVVQEDTEAVEGVVRVKVAVPSGHHVRVRGSDLEAGSVMLAQGAALSAGEVGLLAGQRFSMVTVFRRPTVAILSTGDELRDVHDPAEPGTIVNSNAYALSAQVRAAGGVPWIVPNVPDDLEATVKALQEALTADLLLTCGGVSVGAYDLVKDAFTQVGIEADFWKVRVKPGKPLTFGRRGAVPVVGLPGNPISAMVTFEIFVRPGLRRMLGDARPFRPAHRVRLTHDHRHGTGRPELARATVTKEADGYAATMLKLQGSGSLPSMVGVDAFVLLDADRAEFPAGEVRPALLLRDEVGASEPPFDA